tara:strand:- start:369 stop:1295 length:927 start_codon:yes stop_codon:yes gene_type:complete
MSEENNTEIELKNLTNELSSTEMVHIEWTAEHENILIEWADKATCYRWLHSKSHLAYNKANTWFTIPVIIMSTLTGTANFAQEKFPENIKPYASMGIGAVNIVAGILTTIQQFLKIGELNEAHRVASISWGKFYRNIKVELSKKPSERIPVLQILKTSKEEFDRLMETSPAISDKIIKLFNKTFSGGEIKAGIELSEKQKAFKSLKKPEVCGTLESTSVSVYRPRDEKITSNSAAILTGIASQLTSRKRNVLIEEIITKFQAEKERLPNADEVMSEMDNKVSAETIQAILDKHNTEDNTAENPLNQIL